MATKTITTSTTTTKRRYWRRTDTPRPFWPWGLLPLLGMAVLFIFGALVTAPAIQAEVRSDVQQRLTNADVNTSEILANGRQVTVRVGSTEPDDAVLEALAASTKCDTWAGELTCPTLVDIDREAPEAQPAVAVSRPHQFAVVREADAVVLRGEAPSADARQRIVNRAGEHFDQVRDELRISNESASAGYGPAADRAVAVVSRLVNGEATWSGEQLSVTGTANAGDVAIARAEFENAAASGMLGRFDVQALEQPGAVRQRCNDSFNDVLSTATIRFQTGSAEIASGNEELLQRLAGVASRCPGSLTVAGHTDSQGDADMNEALSLARASAVRNALAGLGVDTERMNAVGHGETQPIADNTSAAGRAKNRRIAITVTESE